MTRGENNNNPGNIRLSDVKFQGEVESSDANFKAFESPVMGIRALARILLTYYHNHHLNTVRGIISRWAPPGENDSEAYIEDVATRMGVQDGETICLDDAATLDKLVTMIIYHENGHVIYTSAQITDGVDAALETV